MTRTHTQNGWSLALSVVTVAAVAQWDAEVHSAERGTHGLT